MGFSIWHWIIMLGLLLVPALAVVLVVVGIRANRPPVQRMPPVQPELPQQPVARAPADTSTDRMH